MTLIADLVDECDLGQLNRLAMLCARTNSGLSRLSFSWELLKSTIHAELDPLLSAFPRLTGAIDVNAAAKAISDIDEPHLWNLDRTETDRSEADGPAQRIPRLSAVVSLPEEVKTIGAFIKKLGQTALHEIPTRENNSLEKAEAFLEHQICKDPDPRFGDQEALVYLASRGKDRRQRIREVIQVWREAADGAIERSAKGQELVGDNGNIERFGQKSLAEARDIQRWSTLELGDFWDYHGGEELVINATMLRTVEWCDIGGFDDWWKRWADEVTEEVAHSGIGDSPVGAVWLFSLARSGLAIELLGDTINSALWSLSVGKVDRERPWQLWRFGRTRPKIERCVTVAATILFASSCLADNHIREGLLSDAATFVSSTQGTDGSWPFWASDNTSSVEATAMAIHALAVLKPRGWQHLVEAGAKWLWSQQDPLGFWYDESSHGCSAFQTVLALDAIELAGGGNTVTFRMDRRQAKSANKRRRPKVAKELIDGMRSLLTQNPGKRFTAKELNKLMQEAGLTTKAYPASDISNAKGYLRDEEGLNLVDRGYQYEKGRK